MDFETLNEKFMREALKEAELAASIGEVPVGAVIVRNGEIIARAHNLVETLHSSGAHAEMLAIQAAEDKLGAKWLGGCTLYVTLEPCAMCAGAMVLARIDELCFGARDPKNGAVGSIFDVARCDRLNHIIKVNEAVLEQECSEMLTSFFRDMRSNKIKWRKTIQ